MSRKPHMRAAMSDRGSWSSSEDYTPELLPGLPNDIAALVLARLPRSLLLDLKSVCKAWWNALVQPFVADTRVKLGCVEEWVCVQSWNSVTAKLSWWAFDWQAGKWLCLPKVPCKRGMYSEVFGRASAVLNGKLYVMGGKAGEYGPTLRDLFVYCPLRNKWSRGKPMNNTRHSPVVSVLRGKAGVSKKMKFGLKQPAGRE